MSFFKYPFFIKLFHWEYWPTYIVHAPTMLMWLYFACRAKALFFFTRVNPVIETGGVMGESKINILNRMPASTLPKTVFVQKKKDQFELVLTRIQSKQMEFPLIAKPDIGERGFLVEKLVDKFDLQTYFNNCSVNFMIQDFIDYPMEISVLYYRLPDTKKGRITSVCIKDTLKVTGDGHSSIEQLMSNYPRARLQIARFKNDYPAVLKEIVAKDEIKELEPIGNHSRGTTFLNGNHHIDEQLTEVFNTIALQMKDIYYGRFDLKCASMKALKKGKDFKILEFNGIASEPAHIYDPSYPVIQAYKDLWQHWKIIFKISTIQAQKGILAMSLKDWRAHYRKYATYLKDAEK